MNPNCFILTLEKKIIHFWYYVFNYSENSYHLCIEHACHLHKNYAQQKMHLYFVHYSHVCRCS